MISVSDIVRSNLIILLVCYLSRRKGADKKGSDNDNLLLFFLLGILF